MNDKTIFLARVRDITIASIANPNLNGELISRELKISRMQLHRLLKQYAKTNASDFILNIRIEYAKAALLNSESHISSIAQEVGFRDPSYFSKIFKKVENCSPSEYRQT